MGDEDLDKILSEENLKEIVQRASKKDVKRMRTKAVQKTNDHKYTKTQQNLLPKKNTNIISSLPLSNDKDFEAEEDKMVMQVLKENDKIIAQTKKGRRDLGKKSFALGKVLILEASPKIPLSIPPKITPKIEKITTIRTANPNQINNPILPINPTPHINPIHLYNPVQTPIQTTPVHVVSVDPNKVKIQSPSNENFTQIDTQKDSTDIKDELNEFIKTPTREESPNQQVEQEGKKEETVEEEEEYSMICIDLVDKGMDDSQICEELLKLPTSQPLSLALGGNDMQVMGAQMLGEILSKGKVIIKILQLQWNLLASDGVAMLISGLIQTNYLTLIDLVIFYLQLSSIIINFIIINYILYYHHYL